MEFNMEPEKKLMLDNGYEITYYELGEENEDVVVIGQWYYYTFMDWLRALGKDLHVYALILRGPGQGPEDIIHENGQVWWEKLWANDIMLFTKKLGITNYVYGGKCHGSFPAWQLALNKEESGVRAIIASSWIPNRAPVLGELAKKWGIGLATDLVGTISTSTRFEENVNAKLAEIKTLGAGVTVYTSLPNAQPLSYLDSNDEVVETLKKVDIPVLVSCGYEDPLFDINTLVTISGCLQKAKVVLYPGERHFYEMDIPERLASEWVDFIKQVDEGLYIK